MAEVELLEKRNETNNEVRTINQQLFLVAGKVEDKRIVVKLCQSILGKKESSEWEEIKILCQFVDLIQWVYMTYGFEACGDVFEHILHLFLSLLFSLGSQSHLLLIE